MKTIFLVNAAIALAFGIFIELVRLCDQIGVSPWWIAVAYIVLFAWWFVRECQHAPLCAVAMHGGMNCPDCMEHMAERGGQHVGD
jgi:hypothetical protein